MPVPPPNMHTVAVRPRAMYVVNLATEAVIPAQFNPTELRETIKAAYGDQTPVGMSHATLQYSHTENHKIGARIRWIARSRDELADLKYARRQLMALMYPRGDRSGVAGAVPPRALFVWPNLIAMNVVVDEVQFSHRRFNVQGDSVDVTASLQLREVRDVRLLSEDVAAHGTIREGVLGQVLE